MINSKPFGQLTIVLSAVCIAFSTVFTHKQLETINPIALSFYCFLLVIIISIVMRKHVCNQAETFQEHLRNNIKHSIFLNITTATDWILYFIALKYIDGGFTNALVFGITPISSLYFSRKQNFIRIVYSITILLLLSLMAFNYIKHQNINSTNLFISIVLAIAAGVAVGGTTVSLKSLSNQKVPIIDVILIRYLLTFVISFVIIIYNHTSLYISLTNFLKILSISLIFILLPAYLVQSGIKHVSAFQAAIIGSSIPAITYLFSVLLTQSYNIEQLLYIIGLFITLVILTTRKDKI